MQQEVVLALLSKEPLHGYELRARLGRALGPLGDAISPGQVYVTLGRLEKLGLATSEVVGDGVDNRDRRVYEATAAGRQRVAGWLADVGWPRPDLTEFHLKLVAAATTRLADPVEVVARQRRELLRRLRDVQRAALDEPDGSTAALLMDGIILRLQADLQWLQACERNWSAQP